MPKTQYYTAASVDGFIADANHALDWLFQFGTEGTPDYAGFIGEVGALAMGSSTYEWIRRYLLGSEGETEGWPYRQPAWVFSTRSLPVVPGADIRFVRGPVAPVHREMMETAAGKNVWLVGGGDLVGQFHDAGLLDEVIVTLAPVTLGTGKPLLPRAIVSPPMHLVETQTYPPFVQLRYAIQRPDRP
jgi:dihydrofolate reductase